MPPPVLTVRGLRKAFTLHLQGGTRIPALDGLDLGPDRLRAALRVDRDEWRGTLDGLAGFYEQFGPRLPAPIRAALTRTRRPFAA